MICCTGTQLRKTCMSTQLLFLSLTSSLLEYIPSHPSGGGEVEDNRPLNRQRPPVMSVGIESISTDRRSNGGRNLMAKRRQVCQLSI